MWKDLNNTFWCVSVTHGWVPNAEVRRAARWTGVSPPQSLTDIKAWELIRPLPNSRLVFGKWEICYSNVRTLYAIRLYDTDFIHSKSTLTPKFLQSFILKRWESRRVNSYATHILSKVIPRLLRGGELPQSHSETDQTLDKWRYFHIYFPPDISSNQINRQKNSRTRIYVFVLFCWYPSIQI